MRNTQTKVKRYTNVKDDDDKLSTHNITKAIKKSSSLPQILQRCFEYDRKGKAMPISISVKKRRYLRGWRRDCWRNQCTDTSVEAVSIWLGFWKASIGDDEKEESQKKGNGVWRQQIHFKK